MANMSRTSSTSSAQGFSILQPTLGAPLSFLPAVGTKELDSLIDAYLAGPASPQEKRAAVALEFFEYSARTGQNFKYFAVPTTVPATNSPIGVTPSPVMSELTYASSSQASTPATPATRTSRSAKRPETTDFSHLPGMRIITVDGQDVTNNVARGCKTKEQRDHAHLMRILKACDACKKKKIRCDPSHRKRSASHVESGKSESVKPAKKSKKASASTTTPISQSSAPTPAPELDYQPDTSVSLEDFSTTMADWDQYFTFNEPIDASLPQDFYNAVPQDYNFFFEPEAHQFSPATSGSSAVSPAQPLTPTGSGVITQADYTFDDSSFATFAPSNPQEAMLPYLASGAHGSNYVDFNLFSPSASFIDEEPRKLKAGEKRKVTTSPVTGLSESLSPSGVSNDQQYGFNHSPSLSLTSATPAWDISGGDQHALGVGLGGGYTSVGMQLPFHNVSTGHGIARGEPTGPLPHGLQSPSSIGPIDVSERVESQNGTLLHQARRLRSTPVAASASMILEGVSPSTSSGGLAGTTAGNDQVANALTVTSPVRKLDHLPIFDSTVLTLKKVPRAFDAQRPTSQLQTSSRLPARQPQSPSLVIVPGNPAQLGQGTPASVPASLTTGGLTSVNELRPSAGQGHQRLPANAALTVATGIQTTNAAGPRSLAHGDSSLQQETAECCTNVNVQNLSRSTVPDENRRCLSASISPSPVQLPENVASLLDAVISLTHPVWQLLEESTTPLSVLTQLAVFGLVSMLLIVAVTSDLHTLQLQQLQLQYPIFACIIPLLDIMMISFFLSTLSSQQQDKQTIFSSQRNPSGLVASVRSILSGPSLFSSSPRRRQQQNQDIQHHSKVAATTCLASHRVMAVF